VLFIRCPLIDFVVIVFSSRTLLLEDDEGWHCVMIIDDVIG
jgi:hypothetical protein